MKVFKISNCHECPFAEYDRDKYGYGECNASEDVLIGEFETLPNDDVHYLCPLKKTEIKVKLK